MIRLKKALGDQGAFNQGVEAYNRHEFARAVKHFRKAVEEHPNYADYHFTLGLALRETGELEGAIQSLRHALEINPNYVHAKNELAILLALSGKYDPARQLYREVVARFVYNSEEGPGALAEELLDIFEKGIELLEDGGYGDAVVSFRQAANSKASMPEIHFNQAVEYFINNDLDSARVELEQTLRLDPFLVDAYILSCEIARREGDFEQARKACLQAIRFAPEYPDLHYHLACACREMGELKEACRELEHALELKPDYGRAMLELADVALELDHLQLAEECLNEYARRGESCSRMEYLLGMLYEGKGQYERAREKYEIAMTDPRWLEAANSRLSALKGLQKN